MRHSKVKNTIRGKKSNLNVNSVCFTQAKFRENLECGVILYTHIMFFLNQKIKEAGDVDSCVVTMKFPSGAIGVMDFARNSCYGYDIRLEVT